MERLYDCMTYWLPTSCHDGTSLVLDSCLLIFLIFLTTQVVTNLQGYTASGEAAQQLSLVFDLQTEQLITKQCLLDTSVLILDTDYCD